MLDPVFVCFLLFGIGALTFTLSTLTGGGGAMAQIPIMNALVGPNLAAPLVNLGAFISRPSRVLLFWKHIYWPVFWYYVPMAILGSFLASWWFSSLNAQWIQIVVGLFLLSTVFQYRFGKKKQSFNMRLWYFMPLGLVVSFIGTLTGGMGPILNPFLLNLGLKKEALVGTKGAQSFFMGIGQITAYSAFGLLSDRVWLYGLCLGLGASLGNYIGKRLLYRISEKKFRQILIGYMVLSGVLLVYGAL